MELAGKVAIVTGSARNIGRAVAEELARGGAAVVINALQSPELCQEVVGGITASGGRALPFVADVRDPDAVGRMVDAAIAAFGGIDILVHNAASRGTRSIEELDFDAFFTPIDISINGLFHLVKAALPSMKQRPGGSIVGVSSMTAIKGAAGRGHVSAGKLGQTALLRSLAHELGAYQIRANTVAVGLFQTDRSRQTASPVSPIEGVKIPLGRKGVPQDLANLIRFLVGPDAEYISGQTIHCNGAAYMSLG